MNLEILLLIVVGCLVVYLHLKQAKANRWQDERISELTKQVEQLATTTNVLCASAVGVDKRVIKLERNGRDMIHRQESMETSKQSGASDRPYGEAIQMVQKGADTSKLVDELGLSKSEAELLVMLHGVKKAV